MRQRTGEAQQFLGARAGADSQQVYPASPEPTREGEILRAAAMFDAGLHDHRVVGDRSGGSREREILGGIVSGVDPETSRPGRRSA